MKNILILWRTQIISGIICLILSTAFSPAFAMGTQPSPSEQDGEKQKETQHIEIPKNELHNELQKAFGEIFSSMGAALGGMTAGMRDGAQGIQAQLDGADGTRLISNKEDLKALTEISILKTEKKDNAVWCITLAIKNTQEFSVRLVNLTSKEQVILLDNEGFAHNAEKGERTITVPERAAVKAVFTFTGLEKALPKAIRLYGMEIGIPQNIIGNNSELSL